LGIGQGQQQENEFRRCHMTLSKEEIRGIMPPVVTPFDADDMVDETAFRQELRFMLDIGVQGVVCGGSTGEGATLSLEEARQLYTIMAEEVQGRILTIGGVIANSTIDAIDRARPAREAGLGAVMVTPVHYPAFMWDDDGLRGFYSDVWEKGELPIIVYNVLQHAPVLPHMWRRLVDIPGIIAVKESAGGDLETLTEIMDIVGDRVAVTFASDSILMPGYAIGAVGTISGINTVLPELCLQQWRAMEQDDIQEARRLHFLLHKVNRHLQPPNWNSRIKEAINLQGRTAGKARSPQRPLNVREREALADGLREAGVPIGV